MTNYLFGRNSVFKFLGQTQPQTSSPKQGLSAFLKKPVHGAVLSCAEAFGEIGVKWFFWFYNNSMHEIFLNFWMKL